MQSLSSGQLSKPQYDTHSVCNLFQTAIHQSSNTMFSNHTSKSHKTTSLRIQPLSSSHFSNPQTAPTYPLYPPFIKRDLTLHLTLYTTYVPRPVHQSPTKLHLTFCPNASNLPSRGGHFKGLVPHTNTLDSASCQAVLGQALVSRDRTIFCALDVDALVPGTRDEAGMPLTKHETTHNWKRVEAPTGIIRLSDYCGRTPSQVPVWTLLPQTLYHHGQLPLRTEEVVSRTWRVRPAISSRTRCPVLLEEARAKYNLILSRNACEAGVIKQRRWHRVRIWWGKLWPIPA